MIKLKWSKYAEQLKGEKTDLIYNWKNNQIYRLPKGMIAKVQESLLKGVFTEEVKTAITQVYLEKILVEERSEEKYCTPEPLRDDMGAVYFMPSMNCNFRCTYCFVGTEVSKGKGATMPEDLVKKAAEFVANAAEKAGITELKILLFGGEPTINITKHILFMKHLNKLSDKRIQYDLITNGWYMPFDKINEMIEEGLSTIQITLDGPEKVHDSRRKLCNGGGTYAQIISNILKLKDKHINLAIRVNADNENINSINELVDELIKIGLANRIVLQIAPVDPSDFSDNSGYDEKVIDKFADIYDKAEKNRIEIVSWNRGCSVRSKLFMAIDPRGDLYKCPDYVGNRANAIGNIETGYNDKYSEFLELPIADDCQGCIQYGLCRGGCQYLRDIDAAQITYCIKEALSKINRGYLLAKYDKEYAEFRASSLGKSFSKFI